MSCYCINLKCPQRENPDEQEHCLSCQTPLLVQGRYRLLRPLRELDEWEPSEIFEVVDQTVAAQEAEDQGDRAIKVLKILKKSILLPLFEREAITLQRLDHPGIPQVEPDAFFPVDLADGRQLHCLVMEKIQGENLDAWLQQHGPIDAALAVDWLTQLTALLSQLHQEALFHRDIKLSNIMLRPTGQLALIDFGTVRPMTGTYFAKVAGQRDITSVVSPGYTPLEQMNGKAVPQSDFYALGRSLVHLLTGKHPIDLSEDETTGRLEWRDRTAHPIADWLIQLLDDMMAPFPGQRPLSASAVLDRLIKQQDAVSATPTEDNQDQGRQFSQKQQMRWFLVANVLLLLLQVWIAGQRIKQWKPLEESDRPIKSERLARELCCNDFDRA